MVLQIDSLYFYIFIFLTFFFYLFSIFMFFKYRNYGETVKEEIHEIINYSSTLMKKEFEKNLEEQLKVLNRYIDNIRESAKEFEETQFKSFDNFRIQIEYLKQDLHEIHKKIKKENELQKEIRERDGIIARKNREISKLKARISNVN